jgi:hypothetical protein
MRRMGRPALYCSRCWRFLEYSPEVGDEPIVWIVCDRCLEHERPAERERRSVADRACQQCGLMFTPRKDRQLFHSDACRKRHWREHHDGSEAAA